MPAKPPDDSSERITITHFRATGDNYLAKSFSREPDGSIRKQSHAQFSRGVGWKHTLEDGLRSLPAFLEELESTDCIATGVFDCEKVKIVPDGSEIPTNSSLAVRHRTKKAMIQPVPGVALFDHDRSPHMPDALRSSSPTELMAKLCGAVPGLKGVPWVGRGSSSQGIYNKSTGERYSTGGGIHVYVATNITDLDALRQNLEVALWRAGLGYIEFARNGRRLPRTIIDLTVLSSERLIFEAAPILGPGVGRTPPVWESSDD